MASAVCRMELASDGIHEEVISQALCNNPLKTCIDRLDTGQLFAMSTLSRYPSVASSAQG